VLLTDNEGKESKGASNRALIVLERHGETTGHMKKAEATKRWNKRRGLVSPIN
jgi:hypothetical protein